MCVCVCGYSVYKDLPIFFDSCDEKETLTSCPNHEMKEKKIENLKLSTLVLCTSFHLLKILFSVKLCTVK